MSFQWGLIASFLYFEIFIVCLLLLPFISAQRWQKLFKSRFMRGLGQQVYIYFYVVLAFLILCLIDAVREMRKYDSMEGKGKDHQHLEQELRNSMVLFRAQRNFYITGFSLFLVFVIRRLMTLMATEANLAATAEAAMKQASSATETAQRLLSEQDDSEDGKKEHQKAIEELEKELAAVKKDHGKALLDIDAIKSQSEGLSREYDRLTEDHAKLTGKLAIIDGEGCTDKKDD